MGGKCLPKYDYELLSRKVQRSTVKYFRYFEIQIVTSIDDVHVHYNPYNKSMRETTN